MKLGKRLQLKMYFEWPEDVCLCVTSQNIFVTIKFVRTFSVFKWPRKSAWLKNFKKSLSALLTDSLRLRLIQACQGDRVNLQCPRNTYISPHNAFFGRLVPSSELCPLSNTNIKKNEGFVEKEDTSCDFAETHSVGFLKLKK